MSATSVSVFVSSPDTHSERKFDLHTTIGQLKTRLEHITGITPTSQKLVLSRTEDGQQIRVLDDDSRPLGFYSPADFQTIQVVDLNPMGPAGMYSDVSQVEKFELSDEQYAKRDESLLKFKQANKFGRFADEHQQASAPAASTASYPDIKVGARCEVESEEEGLQKRGTVRFFGSTAFGKGTGLWVGVEYDEPMGKNDGSVQGHRYFTCPTNHGAFVRPERVTVGDFPPITLIDEDEEI
ncbi:hypothetical protein DACRYDRAFT_49590 [Dacryopinax primogenitus]|uniref:CAP-Gly domain-containing protein n=1 Tax=Dacryopinax primogenitus (strain DJM 731) TaxID=1858805 RepID=M5G534_DACPD|nr:uncharacterized protein DACRYDRAFT_49590 [Dacryopinax primogenitus]EJU03774.1 hypothetical protein DACRYDRAFT_49590 [Dacryopinax primogenitus]